MLPLLFIATLVAHAEVPREIYHVGQKPYLLEDSRLGTIPDDVWEKQIMGRGTTFGLVPYRRGLYGGENFDNLDLYANSYVGSRNGKPTVPWVMKIVIKPECREPRAVTDLATDERFVGWLAANVNDLVRDASFCLNAGAKHCGELIVGTQPIANGQEENACDDVLQKFMKDVNPRVVKDSAWEKSWYLRDRACIEKLDASPAAVLEILADAGWDRESRLHHSGTTGGAYATGTFAILVGALADAAAVPPQILAKLRAKTAASDIRELGADSRLWIREAGPALIDAYARCETGEKRAEFRAFALAHEAQIHRLTFANAHDAISGWIRDLAKLCR